MNAAPNLAESLNDEAKWRSSTECVDVLCAGVNYLYERLGSLPGREAPLHARIRQLGNLRLALRARHGSVPSTTVGTDPDVERFIRLLDDLGTLGFSLWHLKEFEDSAAFRRQFSELARVGEEGNSEGDALRLRGQGFMFYAAGFLAREGFAIEFIDEAADRGQRRPDFYARRDGETYPCETTSKHPRVIRSASVEEFWARIVEVVEAKKTQIALPCFPNGVLIVECSRVFDLLSAGDVPLGGTLYHLPGQEGAGPPGGSAPMIRYDDSKFSKGLLAFGTAIENSGIRTLMLWNRTLTFQGETLTRRLEHRVIGTMAGRRFWAYFPNAVVFPGPNVEVKW